MLGNTLAAGAADDAILSPCLVPPPGSTVDVVLAAQARATPSAEAVCGDAETLTYEHLHRNSDRLAARLQQIGVRRGQRVALVAERSAETIVAMAAVLKAGAAYIPFDPTYADDRLAFMVDDCAPAAILAQVDVAGRNFAAGRTVHKLADLMAGPDAAPERLLGDRGEDPAYVMYTSGTTGRPKGVVIPHRAILSLVRDQRYFTFSRDEVFLHLTTLSFDPSTLEIWGALLNGGKVAVVAQHGHHSLDDIVAVIRRHKPTSTCLTPGIFHLLVDHKLAELEPLRQIMSGGEVLSPSHVRKALAAWPHAKIVNAYGPTECTTLITYYAATAGRSWGDGAVPIGEPLARTHIEILDDDRNPVADGDIGQLCAGGEGLALGYLNRPELTAEKFIVRNGVRLYQTGDLVRRRPDGLIDFIGRADTQVKIDGKRVELGEIEASLREDARIADVVVVLDTTGRGKRLVAYLTWSASAADKDPAGVLAALRTKLPAHMVPYLAMPVDAIPLTPNGKVDRAKLPRPPIPTVDGAVAPRDEVETKLRDIWRLVLGFEQVGAEDNFFDLGGTSVQLMEVHERIQKAFGRDLEIVAMFERPKIASLARMLRGEELNVVKIAAVQSRAKLQGDALKRMRAARAKPLA